MKKVIKNLIAVLIMAGICVAVMLYVALNATGHYTKHGVINSVRGDIINIIDEDGESWDFYGEGFGQGDKVVITFDNKADNDKYNDEVVKVRKEF